MKKVRQLKFEVTVDYIDGKMPFIVQKFGNKILNALRQHLVIMDKDGQFGSHQGFSTDINVKLKETKYEE